MARAGADVCSVRPGRVDAMLVDGTAVTVNVRHVNPFLREAVAYTLNNMPIPADIIEDAKRWECENALSPRGLH